jgi:coenzyme PQQ synthesis protein D (PqqD)
MSGLEAFQVNAPHVIYENIEGELVLIHMAKGSYYSTDALGSRLWEMIVTGHREDEMREWVGASYQGDAAEIARGVQGFLAELQAEDLIVRVERAPVNGISRPEPASGGAFSAPVLNKYRDMEDMLMLDPIHEVEETGWPAPKPAEAPEASTWPSAPAAQAPNPTQATGTK